MIKTYEQFMRLLWEIEDNADALAQANDFVSKLAKRANVRLKALEDARLTSSPAYKRAEIWLKKDSRRRFSESKKLDAESLRAQAYELNTFLESNSSTLTGELQRRAGLEKLMPNATKKEKNEMRRFLESAAFSEMQKANIGYNIVREAAEAIISGKKVSDLKKIYSDFLKQEKQGKFEMDIIDVWDLWTGA